MKILTRNVSLDLRNVLMVGQANVEDVAYIANTHAKQGRVDCVHRFDTDWIKAYADAPGYRGNGLTLDQWYKDCTLLPNVSLFEEPTIEHLTEHYGHRDNDLVVINTHPFKSVALTEMILSMGHVAVGGKILVNGTDVWQVKESLIIFSGMFPSRVKTIEYTDSCFLLKVDN